MVFRVALDPGQTTGVAWREFQAINTAALDSTYALGVSDIHAIEWPGHITVILDGFLVAYGDDFSEIVIENFRSRPGPAVNLSAPEAIGAVEEWGARNGIPVIRQEVGGVKRRVHNDRLRANGGWFRGMGHARDAARHLLYREEKCGERNLE